MNPGGSNQQNQQVNGNGFGGFQGSMFNLAPASQPPAQQPLPSTGLFGSQPNNNTGPLFGNGASGPSASATPTTTAGFGQPGAFGTAPPSNIFGQATPNKTTSFGQSTPGSGDAMHTSPDAQSNGSASKPSIFGHGATPQTFGQSSGFGGQGGGFSFGGQNNGVKPSGFGQSPSKPLFGQSAPSSNPLFGTSSASVTSAPSAPTTSAPATAASTPSALFQSGSAPSMFKAPEEKKAVESAPQKPASQFPASTTGPSLFSKSETSVPAATSGGMFGGNATAVSQPPSTDSLFTPKPAATTTDAASTAAPKPFGSLFGAKPTAADAGTQAKPAEAKEQKPFGSLFPPQPDAATKQTSQEKPEPKPQANQNPFGGLFAPSQPSTPKASEQVKASTPFSAPAAAAPKTPSFATQPPQPSATEKAQKVVEESAHAGTAKPPSQAPVAPSMDPVKSVADNLQPRKLPSNLPKHYEADYVLLHQVQTLNECFKREVLKLDPAEDDFDKLVMFYTRVRETIGAPLGFRKDSSATAANAPDISAQQSANVSDTGKGGFTRAPLGSPVKSAQPSGIAPGPVTSGPSSQVGPTSSRKRKSDDDDHSARDDQAGKRARDDSFTAITPSNHLEPTSSRKRKSDDEDHSARDYQAGKRVRDDSSTANIFAQSFSKSKSAESGDETASAGTPKRPNFSLDPSTPASGKPSLVSTTPTASPPKPMFPPSTAGTSATFTPFSQPAVSSTPAAGAVQNSFISKPMGSTTAGPSAPPLQMPKFVAPAAGGSDFFAQFKQKSDQYAKEQKAKRKAEDFDSDEDDEAEWERKDAEEQEKKRKEIEAASKKRVKYTGTGFELEKDSSEDKADKIQFAASAGPSVFQSKTPVSGNNIFGHLSATPSDAEDTDANDTEGTSADTEDNVAKDPSFVPASEDESSRETSDGEVKALPAPGTESSANESGDDVDFSKAVAQSKRSEKADTDESGAATPSGGRSLFDRIQYDQGGNPKRDETTSADNKASSNPFGSLLGDSKFASSFNTPGSTTPNLFSSRPSSAQGGNIFASSTNANSSGGVFSPAPATTASGAGSIFGSSEASSKPGSDNTWKKDSPIKFADNSTNPSQPFSTLFGAKAEPPASKPAAAPTAGFSFGAPSQSGSSHLGSSVLNSDAPSRSTTPGITSDTGAEESGDGEAAEALPQSNLASSRVGEEKEDLILELRGRAYIVNPGVGPEGQGVGYVRILKDRTTSRARVLLRADPSGKIILNTRLMKEVNYTHDANTARFWVPKGGDARPDMWLIRVKQQDVKRLADAMEENKT